MRRADQRKFHYIYKITRFDGRYYIGMHSTDNLDDGYFGSGKLITRSIRKYGISKHTKQILEFLPSRQDLRNREEQLVNEEILGDPLCMNIRTGGDGNSSEDSRRFWLQHPEWREATSKRTKELWQNPEYRAKLLKALSERTISEQHRKSISDHAKARWAAMSEEQRAAVAEKIGAAGRARGNGWEGKKHTEEAKLRMSAAAKTRPKRGPLSAETRAKIAEKVRLAKRKPK